MWALTLVVNGEPKGQPRPQAFTRKIKCKDCGGEGHDSTTGEECSKCRGTGQAYYAGVYDPGVANEWKNRVAFELKQRLPPKPLDGPIQVDLRFFLPRPKAAMRQKDPAGPMFCTARPDLDNLEKAVLDVCTQLALWHDDAQIVILSSSKAYHAKDARPGMIMVVRELEV